MDAVDIKILNALAQNARQRASAICADVSLSVSAVIERIRKLEENGVIEQYTIALNQKKLGNGLTAWMEVCLEHPKHYDAFVERVLDIPNVVAFHYLTGDFDFMLQIVTSSPEALETIHRSIKSVQGVSATKTHLVLKTIKDNAVFLPDANS
ncbi:MAG: Lrp/AsnC family transcriptional regulator [Oscillospiraceae bacterium]|jgi:Lrp/AsnC family leucine-responsive transcriptional regulator|nr:Lrp/AsnC family transcriptional regulator [Oscillospiraceae bacterium]